MTTRELIDLSVAGVFIATGLIYVRLKKRRLSLFGLALMLIGPTLILLAKAGYPVFGSATEILAEMQITAAAPVALWMNWKDWKTGFTSDDK